MNLRGTEGSDIYITKTWSKTTQFLPCLLSLSLEIITIRPRKETANNISPEDLLEKEEHIILCNLSTVTKDGIYDKQKRKNTWQIRKKTTSKWKKNSCFQAFENKSMKSCKNRIFLFEKGYFNVQISWGDARLPKWVW